MISNSIKTQDFYYFFPHFATQPMFATLSSSSHTQDISLLLVLAQFKLCKLVGHLQRLLQAPSVLARGLGRHVLAASFAVQQGAQLLNPLAGL